MPRKTPAIDPEALGRIRAARDAEDAALTQVAAAQAVLDAATRKRASALAVLDEAVGSAEGELDSARRGFVDVAGRDRAALALGMSPAEVRRLLSTSGV